MQRKPWMLWLGPARNWYKLITFESNNDLNMSSCLLRWTVICLLMKMWRNECARYSNKNLCPWRFSPSFFFIIWLDERCKGRLLSEKKICVIKFSSRMHHQAMREKRYFLWRMPAPDNAHIFATKRFPKITFSSNVLDINSLTEYSS